MSDNATTTTIAPIIYSRFWERFHSGFLILVIIAALFGNGFVCMAVYKVRRLQKVSNYFLVSLAVSDILVVLLAIPFRIYFELNVEWQLGEHGCRFWIFMDVLCSTASIVNLSVISVDRYIALSQSLRYLTILTVSRCRIFIAAVWAFSFILAVFSLHTWSSGGKLIYNRVCYKIDKLYYTVTTVMGIIIPLIILIVLYCLVFKIALEQRLKIMNNNYNTPQVCDGDQTERLRPRPRSGSSPRRFAIRELKATKTLIIVVGAFLVCWFPLFVLVVIQQYVPQYTNSMPAKTQEILGQLFLYTLPYLNSCLNPYIYTFHNSEFRAVFIVTFRKLLPFVKLQSKNDKHLASLRAESEVVSTDF